MEKGKVSKLVRNLLMVAIILFLTANVTLLFVAADDSAAIDFTEGNFKIGTNDVSSSSGGPEEIFEGTSLLKLETGVICFNYNYVGSTLISRPTYVQKYFSDTGSKYKGTIDTIKTEQKFLETNFNSLNSKPSVTIDFYADGNFPKDKENYLAYEGRCRYYIKDTQSWYDDDHTFKKSFPLEPGNANWGTTPSGIPGVVFIDEGSKKLYNVDWDKNKDQCTGKFLPSQYNTAESPDTPRSCCGDDYIWFKNKVINYETNKLKILQLSNIEGKEITTSKKNNGFCLYNPESIIVEDENTGAYRCNGIDEGSKGANDEQLTPNEAILHTQYDPYLGSNKLVLTDKYNDNTKNGLKTDLGLYTFGGDKKIPLYCHHYFDPNLGDKFEWLTLDDAAKLDTLPKLDIRSPDYIKDDINIPEAEKTSEKGIITIDKNKYNVCNLYLGGHWTGTQCCYNPYDYSQEKSTDDKTYEDPGTWQAKNSDIISNGVCYNSKLIDYATPSDTGPYYALNGEFYSCNKNENDLKITNTISVAKEHNYKTCEAKQVHVGTEDYYSICSKDNNKFFVFSNSQVEDAKSEDPELKKQILTFGYDTKKAPAQSEQPDENIQNITSSLSFAPGKSDSTKNLQDLDSQCCLFNTCWDPKAGKKHEGSCVEEGSKPWENPSEKPVADSPLYICSQGKWKTPLPKYNWYNDEEELKDGKTQGYNLCVQPYSCACPSGAYGETEQCSQQYITPNTDDAKVQEKIKAKPGSTTDNRCTNTPFFFQQDHLCLPEYDKDNKITEANWTSRTKLLALQLMDLAGENEYILHCAPYTTAINNIAKIDAEDQVKSSLNSFCILKTSTATYLGVTLNGLKDETTGTEDSITFDMKKILTDSIGPALLTSTDLFNQPTASCNYQEDTARYGQYNSCNGNGNVAYNNKLKAIIYSNKPLKPIKALDTSIDGESASTRYEKQNGLLNLYKFISTNFYESNKGDQSLQDKIPGVEIINQPADFNNFYLNMQLNNGVLMPRIFGITEKKWSAQEQSQGQSSLRIYSTVFYISQSQGIFNKAIDCNKITQADSKLFCNMDASSSTAVTFIFTPLTTVEEGQYQYFSDLTSKLRLNQLK